MEELLQPAPDGTCFLFWMKLKWISFIWSVCFSCDPSRTEAGQQNRSRSRLRSVRAHSTIVSNYPYWPHLESLPLCLPLTVLETCIKVFALVPFWVRVYVCWPWPDQLDFLGDMRAVLGLWLSLRVVGWTKTVLRPAQPSSYLRLVSLYPFSKIAVSTCCLASISPSFPEMLILTCSVSLACINFCN